MELFESKHLKKMYEHFTSDTIFTIFNCKYCNLQSCFEHYRFDCSCKNCHIVRCKNCQNFNNELDILMCAANEEARTYIFNYVRDFFTLSDETFMFFFNFNNNNKIGLDDMHCLAWDLKKYRGSKKGTTVENLTKTMSFIIKVNRNSRRSIKYKL